MYTIRTIGGMLPNLRKMYMKGRNGIVIDAINTKDPEEFCVNIEIVAGQLNIIDGAYLNKPICIRKSDGSYIMIFMVKAGYEDRLNIYNLHLLGNNAYQFNYWFSSIQERDVK